MRQIMVGGQTHAINHPEQELQLLQKYLDKTRNQYERDIQKKKVPAVKKKIKLGAANIKRVETRIHKVEQRIKWLRRQDQEILALLAA